MFVGLGYLAGIFYLLRYLDRTGLSEKDFWRLTYLVFFGALLGGKILYVLSDFGEPGWSIWEGLSQLRTGFVFYGGFACALALFYAYCRKKGWNFFKLADNWSPALALGHSVGRLGCFAAGCCYGKPTSLPWGVRFTHPESLVPSWQRGIPLHPTQLYESFGNLIIFLVLHFSLRRLSDRGRIPVGTPAVFYVVSYSALRFFSEFLRGDYRGVAPLGLSISQWTAVFFAAGALIIRSSCRKRKKNNY